MTKRAPPGRRPRTTRLGTRLGSPAEAIGATDRARSSCDFAPVPDGPPMNEHGLEPAAQELADATSKPPFLYELGPDGARKVLDDIQAAPIDKPDVDEKWITVPADGRRRRGPHRQAASAPPEPLPAVLYVHGGGWVLGNAGTHDRLVRELAVGANAAVVFVEYDRSPEARYPVAIEQAYATARWITRDGTAEGLDASRLAVAGDSVGGNMAAALTILAKQRGDVDFVHQSLYYPVTDAAQDTDSYREFADGPFLTAQGDGLVLGRLLPRPWAGAAEITASPLRATPRRPRRPAARRSSIVDENDVLRDEGEAYARKLTEAGVPHHQRPLQRHAPRLHDAQPPPATARRDAPPSNRRSTSCARRSARRDRPADTPTINQQERTHVHLRRRRSWTSTHSVSSSTVSFQIADSIWAIYGAHHV